MGTYYNLVKTSNKTMFELGKSHWLGILDVFEIENDKFLLYENEDNEKYLIDDEQLLAICIFDDYNELFDEPTSREEAQILSNKIVNFCDKEEVYLIADVSDTYVELKNEHGYKVIGSIYN